MKVRLPRITIHYEAFGEGRPLIVLPGWPDAGRVPADYLEPVFADRPGWRRLYLDLPGRGATRGERWITRNDQVLDIVLEVIDQLARNERFVLAGHSAGAYLARAVVSQRAELIDGLLLVVPVIDPMDEDVPEPVELESEPGVLERITADLGPDAARQFARATATITAELYERVKPIMTAPRDAAFLAQLDDRLSGDVDQLPTPFGRPALFLLGRQDAVVGYHRAFDILDDYPRATIAVLDRAGHGLPWEQEPLFRALVSEWLRRVEEATGSQ